MASSSTTTANPSSSSDHPFPFYLSTVNVASFISSKLSGNKKSNNYFSWQQQMLCLIQSHGSASFRAMASFISSKLSGNKKSNNYFSWQQQMLCLIQSHDLLRFIDGTIPAPQPPPKVPSDININNNNNNVVWRTDRVVKGWILGTMADSLPRVPPSYNARDVWLLLEKFFTKPGAATAPPNFIVEDEWREYLPLYRATLLGDWDKAERIIDSDPNAIKARIAFTLETALHVAVGTGKAIHFVQNLVDIMPDHLLGVKDAVGNNALHVAARMGNTEAAEILIRRRPDLLCMPDNDGLFPVHMAALNAHRETLWYLITMTKDDCFPSPYIALSGLKLLCFVIHSNLFDVALYLAKRYPHLATLRLPDGNSALLRIVLKDSAFANGERSFNFVERFIYSVSRVKETHRRKQIHEQALELVKCLCENMESSNYRTARGIYGPVMIAAARLGVHEVIEEIVGTFPSAIHCRDFDSEQYIFHVAVENRNEKVFNLVYQASNLKQVYLNTPDTSGNSLLHFAARLAPSHKLNLISSPALQMQRELQWFQEVEKFLNPFSRERSNDAGKTPKMVFTEEHMELKANGEKWMKGTSISCTIAAALIAIVVFAAAITVPDGNRSAAFILFVISDAISLFTSITSLLMFMSILTSRYTEQDFLYVLPKRLCIGLVTLFMSILFMIVAFSATICLVFGKAEKNWILILVAALAYLPVTTFVLLQSPLLVDVISNTYGRGIFGKQSNRPFS